MSPGQQRALRELQEIERFSRGAFSIVSVVDHTGDRSAAAGAVIISVSMRIGQVETAVGGLSLRDREEFQISVPAQFPFCKPDVRTCHDRFAGFPHVQWRRQLCLYQAAADWNPADGMFGLIERLDQWLRRGAKNELDAPGEPLHPPAIYVASPEKPLLIRANCPTVNGSWCGCAVLSEQRCRIDVVRWISMSESPPANERVAMAILFDSPFPWEYPSSGADLLRACEGKGISRDLILDALVASALRTNQGAPLYLILGTAMRGLAGEQGRQQHISAWTMDQKTTESLRKIAARPGDTDEITSLREQFGENIMALFELGKVEWCRIMEDRPEVVVRRDRSAYMEIFAGKTVAIWGCGALGANIAQYLCQASVQKIVLRDQDTVTPGVLIRQPYTDDDIGSEKVRALAARLLAIRPDVNVEPVCCDLTRMILDGGTLPDADADYIIDATASGLVQRAAEMIWNRSEARRATYVAVVLDREAHTSLAVVANGGSPAGAWDLFRKAKIRILQLSEFADLAARLYPDGDGPRFQPEPGCSEPTFIGSAADTAALSGVAANLIAQALSNGAADRCAVFAQPTLLATARSCVFGEPRDYLFGCQECEIRVTPGTFARIAHYVESSCALKGRTAETGGLLWGEWDDALNIIWITDASGPPRDSVASSRCFVCGVEGTAEEHNARLGRSKGAVGFIGMWHTHPLCEPFPSDVDMTAMERILSQGDLPGRRCLLMIIGRVSGDDHIGFFPWRRDTVADGHAMMVPQNIVPAPIPFFASKPRRR